MSEAQKQYVGHFRKGRYEVVEEPSPWEPIPGAFVFTVKCGQRFFETIVLPSGKYIPVT